MAAPQLGDAFGQERVIRYSCELLKAAGHNIWLVGDRQVGALPLVDGSLTVEGISSFHFLSNPLAVSRAHAKVARFVERISPDIVHWHDLFDARLVRALSPIASAVLTAHTVAPSCPSSARLVQQGGVCHKRSGLGCVAHSKEIGCLSFLKSDLHRAHAVEGYRIKRRAMQHAVHRVFPISRYVESTLVADGWPQALMHFVPNPLPSAQAKSLSDAPENLIVFAARLTPLKGLADLLEALQHLAETSWTLWVCGDGELRQSMERLAQTYGFGSRVRFLGRTSPDETLSIMASAAVVVAPNRGPEAFGLSVAEALSMGTPVVGYDVPALNELIPANRMAPLGKIELLAKKIKEVLKDPHIARQEAKGVQIRLRDEYSSEAHLAALLSGYRRIPLESARTIETGAYQVEGAS